MSRKIYGLTQCGNHYFYCVGDQALIIQLRPFPAAWRKTPGTPWKRAHGHFLPLDNLGLGSRTASLQLDPVVEFDRSSIRVSRLIPSTGQFEFEPDWTDSIRFSEWNKNSSWREILSNLMSEIDSNVLEKLRQFSHFHLHLLEALNEWPGFDALLDVNPFLGGCIAARTRVGAKAGEKRSRINYGNLVMCTEKEIAGALGFGESDDVVSITRKIHPDACKPYELQNIAHILKNPTARRALFETDMITYPALQLLRSPVLAANLAGSFISELGKMFPRHIDILCCHWGTLLKGAGKGDEFTWTYQMALDVVQAQSDVLIESTEDLRRRHALIGWAYS